MIPKQTARSLPRPPVPANLEGIPDIPATRRVCLGWAAALLALVFVLGANLNAGRAPWVQGMMVVMMSAAFAGAIRLVHHGLHAGKVWLRIDETGVYSGRGTSPSSADLISLAWKDLAIQTYLPHDVGIADPSRSLLSEQHMGYWYRNGDGVLVSKGLPLSSSASVRCARYVNHDALMLAMLQHLAIQPGLRLDASLFVLAGVDPYTWRNSNAPRRSLMLNSLLTVALAIALPLLLMRWWPLMGLAVMVASIAGGTVYMTRAWQRAYPGASGPLVFDALEAAEPAPTKQ